MSACLFCEISAGRASSALPENSIFARCEVAFAKAALGHFIEGYSLIVTYEHEASLSFIKPEELRLIDDFKCQVRTLLKRAYGCEITVFEHGCGVGLRRRAGSCIDHAHLHLVPLQVRLKGRLCSLFPWRRISGLAELPRFSGLPFGYLYLEEEREHLLYELDRDVPSQLVRRVIADLTGQGELWDWRRYPFRERVSRFNERIAALRQE
ncbi:MAG: hypothetical protein ABI341_03080 [Nitrososphaera sp.]